MDLTNITKQLYSTISSIHTESYLIRNNSKEVIYPYLTYQFDTDTMEANSEEFYLEIDIFDYADGFAGTIEVEQKLRDALNRYELFTEHAFYKFTFLGSNSIQPGSDEKLKRRNVRFLIKIEWRK